MPGANHAEAGGGGGKRAILVRKHASHMRRRRHSVAHYPLGDVERPALAGVELLVPLPPPGPPPHLTVPLPAYPFESVAAALTTPPPPVVCHRTRRRPDLPDPQLYREVTLVCQPDNP